MVIITNILKVKVMKQLLIVLQLHLYGQKIKVQCLAFVNYVILNNQK